MRALLDCQATVQVVDFALSGYLTAGERKQAEVKRAPILQKTARLLF